MTVSMSLEVEVGVSIRDICSVFLDFGAEVCSDDEVLTGCLGLFNTYFVFRESGEVDEVVAEGANVSWLVGIRGVFHCPIGTLGDSYDEIKVFLRFLSGRISSNFLLSFQYEDIYVVRDEGGIKFLKEVIV